MYTMPAAPLVIGAGEIGLFLLANVIIAWICVPPLIREIRGGMFSSKKI